MSRNYYGAHACNERQMNGKGITITELTISCITEKAVDN